MSCCNNICGCHDCECKDKASNFPTINNMNSISLNLRDIQPGNTIPFDIVRIINGTAIFHTPSSTDFILFVSGIYQVIFTVTAQLIAGVNSDKVYAGLALDGNTIPGTIVDTYVTGTGRDVNLSTQTLVSVSKCNSSVLTAINPGQATTIYINPNITIIKIA